MDKMKAITVYGPRDARMEEVPKPIATENMIVMKVLRTGVCATDSSIYTGESSFIKSGEIVYPCRFGHEWAGIVESVGEKVTKFKPGDRVYADNFTSCGICDICRSGDYTACPDLRSVGTVDCWDGCFAEYMLMPEHHVYHLPDEVTMDEGALIEPGSIAYDAFRNVSLSDNDTAVIYGTGAIGLICAWMAKYLGAGQVILVGRTDAKLQKALEVGADKIINCVKEDAVSKILQLTGGKGASFAIETSGAGSALKQCILATRRYARISVISFYERNLDDIPMDNLVLGCKSLVGAAGRYGNAPAFCEMIVNNPIKLTSVISHHVPFENCLDVFEQEENYRSTKIKIMIDFQ